MASQLLLLGFLGLFYNCLLYHEMKVTEANFSVILSKIRPKSVAWGVSLINNLLCFFYASERRWNLTANNEKNRLWSDKRISFAAIPNKIATYISTKGTDHVLTTLNDKEDLSNRQVYLVSSTLFRFWAVLLILRRQTGLASMHSYTTRAKTRKFKPWNIF